MDPQEILKKPYARLVMPDDDGTFSAEIVEFPGCIAGGDTAAEALANLDDVAADWIAATREQGQSIPEPLDTAGYSGRLVLRMPKGLHRKAALCADRDGVSLNQFIVTCVAEQVGARAISNAILEAIHAHTTSMFVGNTVNSLNLAMIAPPRLAAPGGSWQQIASLPILQAPGSMMGNPINLLVDNQRESTHAGG